jgi:hypothetical protein
MSRLSNRVFAGAGIGVCALALTVSGGVPAHAAPASGPITEAKDVLGVWVGEMTGYQEGQEVDWQYRLTVRKARGQAGVAWQEWRDCGDHRAACAAGKATGGGWGQPTRLLFAMDTGHVIHGVSETGIAIISPGTSGDVMEILKVCEGDPGYPTSAATSGVTQRASLPGPVRTQMVLTGSIARQPG